MELGSLLSHGHAEIFQLMRVSASIVSYEPGWRFTDSPQWRVLYSEPNVVEFEVEHGVEAARYRSNTANLNRAHRTKRPVLGSLYGLCDLFVPVVRQHRVCAVLVVGPFAKARPTSADILERWRKLTGRRGHLADAEFAHYLSKTLSTLVLDQKHLATFTRFLSCMARLIAGDDAPEKILAQADTMRDELENVRLDERIWEGARAMVNEQTSRSWSSPHRLSELKKLGLTHPADQVIVGLLASAAEIDPVEELLRREAFQRTCIGLAYAAGNVISGQVGDHGVMFLARAGAIGSLSHQKLSSLASKAATLARNRFGLRLHLGVSTLPKSVPLSEQYEAALAAAESALSQGISRVNGERSVSGQRALLGKMRQELAAVAAAEPKTLPTRFDRYLESVALRCGYRLEPVRAHVEAGFEDVTRALLEGGALDPEVVSQSGEELDRAISEARTVAELFSLYRRIVKDWSEAGQRPRSAGRDWQLRSAISYLQKHYGEKLTLKGVARVVGFAPNHFSRLFRRRERVTFARYLRQLRIGRAKQLLTNTNLEVKQIARLCGFSSQQYFTRTFQSEVSTTPLDWRRRPAAQATKRSNKKVS